ncbi:MAG: UDP-glucose/GDP-mannose dehydrogenase family protein [Bdellovibrionales bacterium]|nr:UDP-glucose/GDP-mannose dehydrogenase family protein [Bdellovibrionales bacterium]
MKISVFGVGYVGLVTGTCLAEMGNDVLCCDVDENKVKALKAGRSPIYEPGLEDLLTTNIKSERLHFTTDPKAAIEHGELIFIAVGTPSDVDGSADLKYVLQVADTIGTQMSGYRVIINKSTVPVGTAEKVEKTIQAALSKRGKNLDFDVVSNPEFLKEGAAIEDCLRPSRIVVGVKTDRARALLQELYDPFVKNGHPILFMDPLSSEMTKYAANAMLATKISFMNELSRLCEKTGADVERVRMGIGSDPRIGQPFLYAGIGYGGSCFPKDVKALIKTGRDFDEKLLILDAVEEVNAMQKARYVQKIFKRLGADLKGKTIALWGLSFKPGTDDLREAPSLEVIEALTRAGAEIVAHDPVAISHAKPMLEKNPKVSFAENPYDALKGASALCVVTEWKPFREPDFEKMKSLMKEPIIFDGRNIYDPVRVGKKGMELYSVGRPKWSQ